MMILSKSSSSSSSFHHFMVSIPLCLLLLLLILCSTPCTSQEENDPQQAQQQQQQQESNSQYHSHYGADNSFPMQHERVLTDEEGNPLGGYHQQSKYQTLLDGCIRTYDLQRCLYTEQKRIQRNLKRPAAMKNYTQMGFTKIPTPPDLWELVLDFWRTNSFRGTKEAWEFGEMTVNHWDSPTYMIGLHDTDLPGGGRKLERAVWDAAQSTLEAWTGQKLKGTSLYGIRVYTTGAVLVPHVDRVPLISSAIINVAQDTDEPWPLEVIGHDGKAHNVTMVPGDMVLYESHSIIHGRPFPLKGKFMANIFVHFEPVMEHEGDVLPYIDPAIAGAALYKDMITDRKTHYEKMRSINLQVHTLAGNGRTLELRNLVESIDPQWIHAEDDQGWQPLHEAARGGHIETIHYLLERGANINARNLYGATPLYVAEEFNGIQSDVVRFLKVRGAIREEPIPPTLVHAYAGSGQLEELQHIIERNPKLLQYPDSNGWTPLHEAARGGHVHIAEYLIQKGAHWNKQTEAGGTPMWYASTMHGKDSPIYKFFESIGALQLGPDL